MARVFVSRPTKKTAASHFGFRNIWKRQPKSKVCVSVCVRAAKADCVKIMEGGGSSHIQWTSEQRTDGGHRAEERRLLAADCCPRCHSHMFTSHIWLECSPLTRFVGHPDPNIVSSFTRSSSVSIQADCKEISFTSELI